MEKVMNPWHPITEPIALKHLGKLAEELGECNAAVARCIIQGMDEYEPTSGVRNVDWLTDEIADVLANIVLVTNHFHLNTAYIDERVTRKMEQLKLWHEMA